MLAAIIQNIHDQTIRDSVLGKVFPLLHLDFETSSQLDLKKVGASAYSKHPSTVVTVSSFAFGDGAAQSKVMPGKGPTGVPKWVFDHLMQWRPFAAWNAAFEYAFLVNYFGLVLRPEQAICTMQRSLYAGLPGKLEHAGPALGLGIVKDMAGHRLMMSMARPKKDGTFWHDDPIEGPPKLIALAKYCERDVESERAVGAVIPKLPAYEVAVSLLDRVTNDRGICLDLPVIRRLMEVADEETRDLNAECVVLTKGNVTSPGTQTQRLLGWLWKEGVQLASLGKDEVQETMDTACEAELPALGTKVLSIRQRVAKSSVRKLQAMLNTVDPDGRVRGTLQYYGANRTGRFSGRLIQPQNFPRPPDFKIVGYHPNDAIDSIMGGLDNDGIRTFYGEPLSVVSACLRGCLIPAHGKQFLVFDLKQIEARVIAWLAGQDDILKVFADPAKDVYQYTSDQLSLGSRAAGKIAVLGLGFGMGHVAFVEFARTNGLIISKMESYDIVTSWRDANAHVRKFWWDLDACAKSAIRNPGSVFPVGRIKMTVKTSYGRTVLLVQLPSGRHLWYRNPRLVPDTSDPMKVHDAIMFDGVDQITKQWGPVRTWGSKLAENVTQATARDVIVEAALRVSDQFPGTDLVLSVHDEILFETDNLFNEDAAKALVETPPQWALGLPVAAEGGFLKGRYGKA
jgi:DNA polymerase